MSENPKDNTSLEVHNEAQRNDSSSGQGKSRKKSGKKDKSIKSVPSDVVSSIVIPDKTEPSSSQGNAHDLSSTQVNVNGTQQGKRKKTRNRVKKKTNEEGVPQQPANQSNSNDAIERAGQKVTNVQQSKGAPRHSKKSKPVKESGFKGAIEKGASQQPANQENQANFNGQHKKNKQDATSKSVIGQQIVKPTPTILPRPVNCQDESYGPTEACILCCQPSNIFGIGQCLHPACMECVIRMRCFGESMKCHFCREDIEKMYFVRKPPTWDDYKLTESQTKHQDCRKFNICFEDPHTIEVYTECTALSCQHCLEEGIISRFTTFQSLKLHMGRKHNLFYCHICLDHLNVLPKNRQLFSDKELTLHINGKSKTVGGINGHPKCKFCQARFFDDEQLYKHCRKEHFYCSICSNVTGTNAFFKTSQQLHAHYRYAHYPCMNEECVFAGIVFSNEVDLSLHNIDAHAAPEREIKVNFQVSNDHSRYKAPSVRVSRHLDGTPIVPLPQPPPKKPVQDQRDFPFLLAVNASRKDSKPRKVELGFQMGRQKRFNEPTSRVVNRELFPKSNGYDKNAPPYFTMTRAQPRPNELKNAGLKKKESTGKSVQSSNSKEWLQSQLMFTYTKPRSKQ